MRIVSTLILSAILVNSFLLPQFSFAQNQYTITGAGATFPFPLIDLWRVQYAEEHPNISLNYQSIGSGGGVKQHAEKTVNFAASDAPLTASELSLVPDSLTIPEAIGGDVVSYNVPEISQSGLKLTGQQVADIFLGKITKWNDPAIKETNPDIDLPDKSILVVHRSDGSGTTYIFTEYLSIVSKEWSDSVGFGKSVPWPTGVGAAGNEGVSATIKTSPYSIGYVELAYAVQNSMTLAYIQNADGTSFVEPTLDTLSAAAAGAAPKLPESNESWEKVSINNAPGPNSYPITSFTYLLVHKNLETATPNREHAMETVNLLKWMITSGQKYSAGLLYVPLPSQVTDIGMRGLDMVTYNGEPLYAAATGADQKAPDAKSGGCLIATATFGSELAPQVQMLREVRDNVLFGTSSGTSFMGAFNSAYYLFSPTVADWERSNPAFKEIVKITITPMLSTLSILNYVHIGSESEMLGYGIGIMLLNVGMYFVAPAVVLIAVRKKLGRN